MENPIKNRYEFVILFDVENGNPNGDPDAGNMPRVDAETGHGLVTDVCIKRKIRNYIQMLKCDEPPFKIFIKEILNDKLEDAYKNEGITKKTKKTEEIKQAQRFMCKNYYDIRTFGAVMSTGDCPCGVVRGPVQLNFAKSIDPIAAQEITITRMAVTNAKDSESKETEMGKKSFVPYGLYKMEGFISAVLAQNSTGFSEEDLSLFWEAIINMFEHDHSAARGKMIVRKLVVFKHDSPLGNAPSHKLLERVVVKKLSENEPARKYEDYKVFINKEALPDSVTIEEKI
ncbi:MAG: type I-C CRISPR-associated protein Cas7/Csd2 [Lachnospiraceae bacterium]|nr:type I-C CRISPR-associated protein Cas7/Csd2 [Lachnospiraceae bacterium]